LDILTACKHHDLDEKQRVENLQLRRREVQMARGAFEAMLATDSGITLDPYKAETSFSQVLPEISQLPSAEQHGPTVHEMQKSLISKIGEISKAFKDINISDRMERGLTPWPTWIPDWTRRLDEESYSEVLYLLLSDPKPTFYQAAGSSKAEVVFPSDPLLLIARGGVFDRVQQVSPLLDDIEQLDEQKVYGMSKKTWEWYCNVCGSAESTYGAMKARKLAFRKALILGRDVIGKEVDFSDGIFYDMLWEKIESGKVAKDLFTNDAYNYNDGTARSIRVVTRIQQAIWYMKYRSRFFVTEKGYIGRGPPEILPGDQACLLLGGRVPFILREDTDGKHLIVGESCKSIENFVQ
jgi:hypothetical protein